MGFDLSTPLIIDNLQPYILSHSRPNGNNNHKRCGATGRPQATKWLTPTVYSQWQKLKKKPYLQVFFLRFSEEWCECWYLSGSVDGSQSLRDSGSLTESSRSALDSLLKSGCHLKNTATCSLPSAFICSLKRAISPGLFYHCEVMTTLIQSIGMSGWRYI